MDWKAFYAAEAESAAGRDAVSAAVADHATGDADLVRTLRDGGVVSFPHTRLRDSADPLARVAAAVVAGGFERVVALGVLHGGTLPEPERALAAELGRGGPRAAEAFQRLRGAFVGAADADATGDGVRLDPALLANEFSLDLFDVVLRAAAAAAGRAMPRVIRVFVGPTRAPDGTFHVAADVARTVRRLAAPGTALVATGDLVHFGHGYSTAAQVGALPAGVPSLERHFASRVRAMLDRFDTGDLAGAVDASTSELRSDQRHLLPVMAALLGGRVRSEVVSFRLTDYGDVLAQPAPCVVATSVVAYRPA